MDVTDSRLRRGNGSTGCTPHRLGCFQFTLFMRLHRKNGSVRAKKRTAETGAGREIFAAHRPAGVLEEFHHEFDDHSG